MLLYKFISVFRACNAFFCFWSLGNVDRNSWRECPFQYFTAFRKILRSWNDLSGISFLQATCMPPSVNHKSIFPRHEILVSKSFVRSEPMIRQIQYCKNIFWWYSRSIVTSVLILMAELWCKCGLALPKFYLKLASSICLALALSQQVDWASVNPRHMVIQCLHL